MGNDEHLRRSDPDGIRRMQGSGHASERLIFRDTKASRSTVAAGAGNDPKRDTTDDGGRAGQRETTGSLLGDMKNGTKGKSVAWDFAVPRGI